MEILLDTNFILTCTKQKVDFTEIAESIIDEGIKWIVPQQVLNELGNIKDRKESSGKDKDAAKLSFELLQQIAPEIVELKKNPNVDIAIVNYILDTEIVLATLDKGLKDRIKNRILTIRGKKHLELIN
jgi:rRNA-processing protein FCF1